MRSRRTASDDAHERRGKTTGRTVAGVLGGVLAVLMASGAAPARAGTPRWVGTWEAAQVAPGTSGLPATGFADQTVREIVHTSAGGSRIRIRISNVFGTSPLVVSDVHVALRASGAATVPGSTRPALFRGRRSVTIPAGQREFSDPVRLAVGAESDLAVSIYFRPPTGPATWHPDALGTNYYASGDRGADASAAAYSSTTTSWFFLDGVDVANPAVRGAVVTFGPSTTDGVGSTAGADARYPDDLARRLLALPRGQRLSVLNAGISGNELLADDGTNGQSALRRFVRDAVDQTGVTAVIIWEGTNDIGGNPGLPLSAFAGAYSRLIAQAHAHGIRVIGATLQPDEGAGYWTAKGNVLRTVVNDWILTSGAFDGTADFATVLADPSDPARLLPGYDSGDHLHPNDAGYQAIADSAASHQVRSGAISARAGGSTAHAHELRRDR
ncbi:MAG TPA: SGNH/GDSL hydrolase family protein [Trebonia sp.]|jgi:lysophospholipase L1-like esterase|nr:SGNH/GDSL hydrolase family protein [Trebonia sp.]